MEPATSTYRSTSGQYFDSVVFRSPVFDLDEHDDERREYADLRRKLLDSTRGRSAKRSTAAVLAHRTRRTSQ